MSISAILTTCRRQNFMVPANYPFVPATRSGFLDNLELNRPLWIILDELTSKTSSSSDVQLIESVVRFRSRVKYRSPVGVILSHSFKFKHFNFCAYDNVNNPSSVIR